MRCLRDKKAQIGSTLTWIAASFIILFILILFMVFSIIGNLNVGVYINFDADKERQDLGSMNDLVMFLDKSVEKDNQEKTMQEIILESLDPYLEEEYEDLQGKKVIDIPVLRGDINRLSQYYNSNEIDGIFLRTSGLYDQDKEMLKSVKRELEPLCERYHIGIPQGTISWNKDNFIFYEKADPFSIDLENFPQKIWGPVLEIEIPYEGQVVKIKFRQAQYC